MNSPCSTTPGIGDRASANCSGSAMAPSEQSRMIVSPVSDERRGSARASGSARRARALRRRVRYVAWSPRGRKERPRSATERRRAAPPAWSNRRSPPSASKPRRRSSRASSAPPPPLISLSLGSISSAPSTVRSSSGTFVQRRERDAERLRLRGRRLRGRDATDVETGFDTFAHEIDEMTARSSRCRDRASCRARRGRARAALPPAFSRSLSAPAVMASARLPVAEPPARRDDTTCRSL